MKKNYLVKRMAVCLMAAVMSVGAVMTGNLAATPTAAYAQEYLYEGILDISSKGWTKYSTGLNYDMTGGTAGTLSQGARLFVISEKTNRAGNKVSYVYSEDLKKNCYVTSKYIAKVDEKTTEKRGMLDISAKGWTRYNTGVNYNMTGGTAGTLYQDAELTVINEKINNSGNKVSYCYSNDLKKYCYVTSQYITFVEAEGETETGSIDKEKEPEEINYREKIVEIAMAEYKANGERKLAEPIKYNYGYMQKIKEAGSSAWCADFICWCAGQADVPMSVLPHEADLSSTKLTADGYSNYGRTYKGVSLASVRQLSKYLTEHCGAEYYALASKEIKNGSYIPQPGDLILYGHGEDYQHIGMVVEFDSVTKKVVTVEGNTTTKKDDTNGHVATKSRTYNKYDIGGGWYIQGYISPDYDK